MNPGDPNQKPASSAAGCIVVWAYLMFLSIVLAPVVAAAIKGALNG